MEFIYLRSMLYTFKFMQLCLYVTSKSKYISSAHYLHFWFHNTIEKLFIKLKQLAKLRVHLCWHLLLYVYIIRLLKVLRVIAFIKRVSLMRSILQENWNVYELKFHNGFICTVEIL